MGMIIAIIILTVIAAAYVLRFYLLKNSLKRISEQLEKIVGENPKNRNLLLPYPDKDVENMLKLMNAYMENSRKEQITFHNREQEIRGQIENISHDLRTPLTAIIGYLSLLDKNAMREDDWEMILAADKKAHALQRLIGNFYDLSRLEMNDYHLAMEQMDLLRFTRETLLSFYQSLENRTLRVEFYYGNHNQENSKEELAEIPLYVLADIGAMERIFNNMLQNALRYAKSYLSISVLDKEENIDLIFKNDCESLPAEDVSHIFERFYVSDKSRTNQGTGLGLTINKLLAEQMGISVNAKAEGNELAITYHFPKIRKGEHC